MICAASCLITSKVSLFFFVNIAILLSTSIGLSKSHSSPFTIETKASDLSFSEMSFAISAEVTGLSYFFLSLLGRVIVIIIF